MRGLVGHVRHHPGDVAALARAGWRLRRRGWWRRWPFLPVPDRVYWRFRVATATGREDGCLGVDEVVRAARWSVSQKRRR
ncbi:MAG: hypothetical protein B7Z69_05260 [Actinobacteria bacterium 21-73-9]|nr:MAG: hypothetical protein B7Z69_05260 [Actinobacteria bacterium 21-73-9]